jgi:hypothetical protein
MKEKHAELISKMVDQLMTNLKISIKESRVHEEVIEPDDFEIIERKE